MITIDLDGPTTNEIVHAWLYAKWYGGDGPFGRLSSSKTGIHIKTQWAIPEDMGIEESHRKAAGDDPYRILGDRFNVMENNQVLYDKKRGRYAGPWCNNLHTLLKTWKRQNETKHPTNQTGELAKVRPMWNKVRQ